MLSTTTRIAMGLTSLTITGLLAAAYLGLVPDAQRAVLDARRSLTEEVAVSCCLAAQREDLATMQALLTAVVARNEPVCSAAIRREDGTLATEIGPHKAYWVAPPGEPLPGAQVKVPIYRGRTLWGAVEIRFRPLAQAAWWSWFATPVMRLMIFMAALVYLTQSLYLKRILRFLDPTSVVPDRVRATLDTLAEGVVILDNRQQIVLANRAFADRLGKMPDALQGFKPSDLAWSTPEGEVPAENFPWTDAVRNGVPRTGVVLRMPDPNNDLRTLSVNAIPIIGGNGERRGALATFDDVTRIEKQNLELARMLGALKESRDEIQRQNRELHLLATFDPLTQCLNRRSFFEKLATLWATAARYGHPLSFVMVDVDHFKSINDRFGHSTGDVVLKKVGETLRGSARESDLVCRYGGEEFCLLLPQQSLDLAMGAAERYRQAIAAAEFDGFSITASFGVSSLSESTSTSQEMLEQADKALYAAKHGGRNRVMRWDQLPAEDTAQAQAEQTRAARPAPAPERPAVPIQAVMALSSALAYRDTMTAEHSRRVAELCVVAAKGLMSEHECYELELAAMLHDIGKLAIPDSILQKPGKLTEDEWAVMRTHSAIGAQIVQSAFASDALAEVVRTHHAWFGGTPHDPSLPQGEAIMLGARLLAIADAYVAMISDRHYRKASSVEHAFSELRKHAGTQFDPQLVERFIETVGASDQSRSPAGAEVSKAAALEIGLQIERLAIALDQRDFASMSSMAAHLAATAARDGAPEFAEVAGRLERAAGGDRNPDLVTILQLTNELLDLCRATQRSYLSVSAGTPVAAPPR